jgi:hypothetical protein
MRQEPLVNNHLSSLTSLFLQAHPYRHLHEKRIISTVWTDIPSKYINILRLTDMRGTPPA